MRDSEDSGDENPDAPISSGRSELAFGPFVFDGANGLLFRESRPVPLPQRVCAVLRCLLENAGDVVEKDAFFEIVWRDALVGEDSLSKAISLLRNALGDSPHDPDYIQTVPRRGYRFIAPVRIVSEGATPNPALTSSRISSADPTHDLAPAPDRQGPRSPLPRLVTAGGQSVARARWIAALALALLGGYALGSLDRRPAEAIPALTWELPFTSAMTFERQPGVAVSRDGSRLVFTGDSSQGGVLYLRRVDRLEVTPLPGTDDARYPFFSPDGEWVGFFADGKLKKVSLDGGGVIQIAKTRMGFGGSWASDDTILFASGGHPGLLRVPASGGTPQAVLQNSEAVESGITLRFPQVLPGGNLVLVSLGRAVERASWSIGIANLELGTVTALLEGSSFARYTANGNLVHVRDSNLLAVPVDLDRIALTGETTLVRRETLAWAHGPVQSFGVSENGLLAYVVADAPPDRQELVWLDREGNQQALGLPPNRYAHPRLSPDGSRVALTIVNDLMSIWIADLSRQTLTPLVADMPGVVAAWEPGEEKVVFSTHGSRGWSLATARVDTIASAEILLDGMPVLAPGAVSGRHREILYTQVHPERGLDVWSLDRTDASRSSLLASAANETAPTLDGSSRLLAYVSDESGTPEVYVASYPDLGAKRMASIAGGSQPVWHPHESRLYYRSGDRIFEVEVHLGSSLEVSMPAEVLRYPGSEGVVRHVPDYDVGADGRLLVLRSSSGTSDAPRAAVVVEAGWSWLERPSRTLATDR